jgi:hypothetical protein
MAAKKTNPLELNSNTLKELFKDRGELPTPSFSAGGAGIASTTGGRGTVSQALNNYLANIDWKKRTPLQNALEFGVNGLTGTSEDIGREQQKKAIEQMKMEAAASKSETPIQEEEIPTIIVSKPKKQLATKLYRVMYAGKGAESSEVYETKEEADAALKKAGGKGAVAGVNLSQKSRGEEMLSAEDVQSRKQRYMDQLSKTKEISKSESDRLKKIQALRNPQTEEEILQVAENKGRMSDALASANEAKRAKDKEAGAGFASWRSDVKARRESENQLNFYNNQLGLLKQAYSQARQAGDPITALAINQAISSYTAGVPKEMGARKAAAEKGIIAERNKMLAEKMRAAQEEEAKKSKTAAANPDYNQYNQGNVLIARKPVGF